MSPPGTLGAALGAVTLVDLAWFGGEVALWIVGPGALLVVPVAAFARFG